MEADEVLAGLDPEQRAVAEATRGPVCVLAGAGTGKTRAITHRIAYSVLTGLVAPQRVLAVTFTTRAAGELRGRLRQLGAPGVQARTFHAAACKQLHLLLAARSSAESRPGSSSPSSASSRRRPAPAACPSAVPSCATPPPRSSGRRSPRPARTNTRRRWSRPARTPPADAADMARLYDAYEQLRRDRNLLDFEGMLELTAAIFTEHQEVANQFRDQYRHFVVDEYQDVNPLQKLLLDTWLGERKDLCVVGDPNQTIYSFTGASPSYLLGFTVEHPEATVVKLVRDYRSTPQVVHLANGVLAQAKGDTRRHRLELVAQRSDGPAPAFHEYDDEVAEAEAVAKRIRELLDEGVPAREIAVLFRINAQSEPYEQAFTDAGVPYVVKGAERFFERAGGAPGRRAAARRRALGRRRAARTRRPRRPGRHRAHRPAAGRPGRGTRALGVPRRPGPARRGRRGRPPVGGPAGVRRGAGGARRRPARADARRCDARHSAHRQGPGVGRGLPRRAGRGHPADHLRGEEPRADRGGAQAALCRGDAGARVPDALVGAGALSRRAARAAGGPASSTAWRRRAPGRRRVDRTKRRAAAAGPAAVPGLRPSADRRDRAQARPLRGLPGRLRRGAAGRA